MFIYPIDSVTHTSTMSKIGPLRAIARAWYYFRMGYGTYLTFALGYGSTLVTVYYLAIRNAPDLLSIFPHFWPFAILATVIGIPLSIGIGWIHLKRSVLYGSEADIGVESSPYTYKLPRSGVGMDLDYPARLMQLRMMRKLVESSGLLTDEMREELDDLERKYAILLSGGYVGTPRRSIV